MSKWYAGCLLFLVVCLVAPASQERAVTAATTTDWKEELVRSVISLDADKNGIKLPEGRSAALQILEMESPALLKDTFFWLLVDSTDRLGNCVDRGDLDLADLNAIIDEGKKTPPWFSSDLKQVSMTSTVPLSKIGSLFIRHTKTWEPKPPLDTTYTRPYSGIVIDARGRLPVHGEYVTDQVKSCLLPRVWNANMDLVYEKNMVQPDIALKRGIIGYSADEQRTRDRAGNDPLRIMARAVFGKNRTDPVISREDYLKIVSIPENRSLLREGKVVILCDQDTLEGTTVGPIKDDTYYFTWKEIDRALKKVPVSRMDFSDAWEGMKLTVYDIRFVADTAEILPEERERLDLIASALKLAGPDAVFTVEGHTASVGKPEGERVLSIQRAQKMATELSSRGIARERLISNGYGGTRPVASNDSQEGRARNRRVEIIINIRSPVSSR